MRFSLFSLFRRGSLGRRLFYFLLAVSALTVATAFAEESRSSRSLTTVPQGGVKRALLVGVDDYAEFADLKYAVADVEAIRERLIALGFKPEDIVTLKSSGPANLRPTQRNIERQIDALLEAAGPNDLLFLHFSGHGFQTDGDARFAPEDADATNDARVIVSETTISLTETIKRLKASDAKFKWLIVDACRENPTKTRSAAVSARALKNLAPPPGVLVLQSCAEGELSFEDEEAGFGLFTGRLLEAFDGKADFDDDGAISALDVCKYVSEQTAAASKTRFNATQTPYFSGEFADFIVAEDLKIDGLSRIDRRRAESLYRESQTLMEKGDYDGAKEKIAEALKIIAPLPATHATKAQYISRQTAVERLLSFAPPPAKPRPTQEEPEPIGRPTRKVSNAKELVDAIENARPNATIELAAGTYELAKTLVVKRDLTLVGATKNRRDVRLVFSERDSFWFDDRVALKVSKNVRLRLANLSLDENERMFALFAYDKAVVAATNCSFTGGQMATAGGYESGRYVLRDCRVHCEKRGAAIHAKGLDAENCEFIGGVNLFRAQNKTSLRNCQITRGPSSSATSGVVAGASAYGLDLLDCKIVGFPQGVKIDAGGGAKAIIYGSEIRGCRAPKQGGVAVAGVNVQFALTNVKIIDCDTGIKLKYGSKCNARNLEFAQVDDVWSISESADDVILDGRRVSEAD